MKGNTKHFIILGGFIMLIDVLGPIAALILIVDAITGGMTKH